MYCKNERERLAGSALGRSGEERGHDAPIPMQRALQRALHRVLQLDPFSASTPDKYGGPPARWVDGWVEANNRGEGKLLM